MQSKIHNSKCKDGELLLKFHAQSDLQTKIAARAVHSFKGKIQSLIEDGRDSAFCDW